MSLESGVELVAAVAKVVECAGSRSLSTDQEEWAGEHIDGRMLLPVTGDGRGSVAFVSRVLGR